MALIKWEPFRDIDKFFDDDFFNRALSSSMKQFGWELAVDVYDDEKGNIVAEMNLPGIDPDAIDLEIEGDLLRISGSRQEESERNDKNYYSKEIKRGSFERTVRLPLTVQEDATKASYEDGVLKIIMPKKEGGLKKGKIKVERKK